MNNKKQTVAKVISLGLVIILAGLACTVIILSLEQRLGAKNEGLKPLSSDDNLVLSFIGKINSDKDNKEHNVYYSHRCGELYYTVEGQDYTVDSEVEIGIMHRDDKEYKVYLKGNTLNIRNETSSSAITPDELKECELYGNEENWFKHSNAAGDFSADLSRGEVVEKSQMNIEDVIVKLCETVTTIERQEIENGGVK